ncbi:melibiase family protein [Stylonychia lemnae]|uniref:Alpha-galactosidase n=1 Tax=Stylonychia lemnae TaxID=5949 RepID=A0A078B3P5_STYLE|nr:melibiase family protein [Stylonychia lemnae]|eukprot:CDW88128.1 melibiase family protein [Stylonychia lemnae]
MRDSKKLAFIISSVISISQIVNALDNGLGLTPPMGWNSWNAYGCKINADAVKDNANKLISLGLDKIGYTYVIIDDCWMMKDRDANGHLLHDNSKFPGGMRPMSSFLHDNNLKLGLYESAGAQTCQGGAGSLGFETADAGDFAMVKIDYLKYDNCHNENIPALKRFTDMQLALNASGRQIYYSISNSGNEDVWTWAKKIANSWRTTTSIDNSFTSVKYNFITNNKYADFAGVGGWNDPDVLVIGNGQLTISESRTQFALWCFVKAPLILGNDLINMSPEVLAIISNKNLIAINQDSSGNIGSCVMNCQNDLQVYQVMNLDGGVYFGILVVNWNNDEMDSVLLDFVTMGIAGNPYYNCQVSDLWTGTLVGTFKRTYLVKDVLPHDNKALKIKCLPWGQEFPSADQKHKFQFPWENHHTQNEFLN